MVQLYSTLHVLGVKVGESIRRRANGDAGQTAAEYMGIIVIVAAIIAAIVATGLPATIATAISTKITEISGGGGAG
jgi:Flp pilus assembly pilin Flp